MTRDSLQDLVWKAVWLGPSNKDDNDVGLVIASRVSSWVWTHSWNHVLDRAVDRVQDRIQEVMDHAED